MFFNIAILSDRLAMLKIIFQELRSRPYRLAMLKADWLRSRSDRLATMLQEWAQDRKVMFQEPD